MAMSRWRASWHDIARQYIASSADTTLVDDFCREVIRADSEDPRLDQFCAANRLSPSDPELWAGFCS